MTRFCRTEQPEQMYLVCDSCGEAFDSIETAAVHDPSGHEALWRILPESEAM